ncbi:MAG TPA: MATE family efflux transporter, partial [Brevibacterium sp.]|nr:MATE family efflux transporter [Brevibacterium sp.]
DARYLALAQVASFAVFAAVLQIGMSVRPDAATAWAAFVLAFLGARGVTLGLRARGRAWIDRALARGIR